MIPAWWNAKNLDSQKLDVVSNTPSDNPTKKLSIFSTEFIEKRGEIFQRRGDYRTAYAQFKRAFHYYSTGGNAFDAARLSVKLGDISRQLDNFSQAVKFYRRANIFLSSINLRHLATQQLLTDTKLGLALSYRGMGHFPQALRSFRRLEPSYKKIGDHEGLAALYWAMGTTFRFTGDFKAAEQALNISASYSKPSADHSAMAYWRCAKGGLERMRGRPLLSRRAYNQANQFFQMVRDQFGMAYSYCGLGNSYRMQGNFQRGLFYSRRAARLYEKLKLKSPLGFVCWSMAQAYLGQKMFEQARAELQRAKTLFMEAKDNRGLIYCDLGWGDYHRFQADEKCLVHYARARQNATKYKMAFEMAHAMRGRWLFYHPHGPLPEKILKRYKKCGVFLSHFRRYQTLP